MAHQQDIGWVTGLAVSAGFGAAVLLGGTAVAVADTSDASESGGSSSSSASTAGISTASPGADRDSDTGDATDDADHDNNGYGGPSVSARADSADDETDLDEDVDDSDDDTYDIDDDIVDLDFGDDLGEEESVSGENDPDDDANSIVDEGATGITDRSNADGEDSSTLPVQSQAVAALVSSARPQSVDEPVAAVEDMNSAPTATTSVGDPDPLTGVTAVTVTGDDPDGDELSYAATRGLFGSVTGDGSGEFIYRPTSFARLLARFLPFIRSDRFSVTVNDGRGGRTSSTVTTAIVPINSAPRARATTLNAPVAATGTVTGRASAADPNWDKITYLDATFATGKGTVTVRGNGAFTYTPTTAARHNAAALGASAADKTDTFAVTVTDVFGAVTEIPVTVSVSPSNTAPTGAATVGDPDETSGVVTGVVIGSDADGDRLTYSGSTTTAKGTVVVTADGVITYSPIEIARRNAASMYSTPALRSDTFGVNVADGYGGVTTIAVRVGITPQAGAPVELPQSTFCGCTMMSADTIFHADIRDLPVLPESGGWIDILGGSRGATLRANWGGSEWMGSTAGIPVNVVGPDHPTESVVFNRGYSTTGPGIDASPYAIPDRPLVEGMPSNPAWDRHLFVFQKGTCVSQELINVANGVELPDAGVLDALGNAIYRSIWGSTWIAGAGVKYDMDSPFYPTIGWANASRLPQVPMMLRPDEIERGYVDHMLGLVIGADRGAGYVWPARAGDGTGADGVPMGMVFRLREGIDISGYAESTQAVLRALQIHGGVIYDSGPSFDGMALAGMSNGWEGTDYRDMQRELSSIPLEWFDAVDAVSVAADPSIGWQVHSASAP